MRSSRPLVVALVVLGACVGVGAVVPASAGAAASSSACPPGTTPSYPPGQCRLEVDPITVEVGGSVKIGGCGFGKGKKVKLDLLSVDGLASLTLAAAVALDDGCVRAKVTLGGSVGGVVKLPPPGLHVLKATGPDPAGQPYQLVSDNLELTAETGTTTEIGGTLAAHEDSDRPTSAGVVVAAAAFVAVGLVLSLRRHRSRRD